MPVGLKMIRGDIFFSFSSEGITGKVTAGATDVLSGSGMTTVVTVSVIGKAGTAIGFWSGPGAGAGSTTITDFTSTGGTAGFGASATTSTAVGEGTVADFSASAAFTSVVTTEGSVVTGILADMAGSEKGFGFEQPIKTVKITSGITLEIHFIK
ncbi:MAG: hypothetical protein AAB197_02680 [Deltaproteobacteria bacterium]